MPWGVNLRGYTVTDYCSTQWRFIVTDKYTTPIVNTIIW